MVTDDVPESVPAATATVTFHFDFLADSVPRSPVVAWRKLSESIVYSPSANCCLMAS